MASRFTFPTGRLFLIAGPCVIETDEILFRVADHLAKLAEQVPGGVVFKASYDKANRSNAGAFRGPGIEEGLRTLQRVRERTGLPVLTDVHLPEHCAAAAQAVDPRRIAAPALLLTGDADAVNPPSVAQALADSIKGASFASIDRVGHWATIEAPREVGRRMADFLHRVGAS